MTPMMRINGFLNSGFFPVSKNKPSVARITLALCTTQTLFLPVVLAYSKAFLMIRSQPLVVKALQLTLISSSFAPVLSWKDEKLGNFFNSGIKLSNDPPNNVYFAY